MTTSGPTEGPRKPPTAYDAFEPLCDESFRYLQEEYGFRVVERYRSGNYACVLYENAVAAVKVAWEVYDEYVAVYVERLGQGEGASRDRYGWRLDKLAQSKDPGWRPSGRERVRKLEKRELAAALAYQADLLRRYGIDVLEGDFSVFDTIV